MKERCIDVINIVLQVIINYFNAGNIFFHRW